MGLRYDLSRLGPYEFERMIQSLVKGLEPTTIVCGDGRDDGREFFVHDANFEIFDGKLAQGYTVGQAKYKYGTKIDDVTWVKQQLEGEFEKFKKKLGHQEEKIPESYLFFTNVVLTPVGEIGGRDKIEEYISSYRKIIPNILIFGADDIYAMLDNNRNVARCYTSFILPGDVLADLNIYLTSLNNKKMESLIEYARQMFREDSAIHLEQAGSVADKSINIRNVYTDLEFTKRFGIETDNSRIAQHIISLGDVCHRREIKDIETAQKMISEGIVTRKVNEGNIILLGNAGQGKSTVCQLICQIYRACLLKRLKPTETVVDDYLHSTEGTTLPIPKCERFPLMVSLKRYASWINDQGEEGNHSVLGYFTSIIRKKTDSDISIFDFRNLMSGFSWIFFFDGLDEVPASSNRREVLKQINLFLNNDIIEARCDCIIVCTSRQQGYDNAFSSLEFNHYELKHLSKSLCREYITLLLSYLEDNGDLRDQYRTVLWNSLEDPTVSKLMTTPLYTAIIVLLVKVGGTPPKKRYKLFQKYCEVVIAREQQKQLLPQVNEEYDWVVTLHGQIGFLLQLESEAADNVAAEMSTRKCRDIIEEYLRREDETNTSINEIYTAMVTRLPFLAEVVGEDGEQKVVFPLRSIQEYFAAEWIIDFSSDETRREVLERISVSIYWRNVYLFVNGKYAGHDRNRVMNDVMLRICQLNNGDVMEDVSDDVAQKIVLQGSYLALDILQDEPFSRSRDWHGYIDLASKLLESHRHVNAYRISRRFLILPRRYEEWLLNEKVIPIVDRNKRMDQPVFYILWGIANRGNSNASKYLERIVDELIIDQQSDVNFLMSLGYRGLGKKALYKLFSLVTEDFFYYFASSFSNFVTEEKEYWEFIKYCKLELGEYDIEYGCLRQACYRALSYIRNRFDSLKDYYHANNFYEDLATYFSSLKDDPFSSNFCTLLNTDIISRKLELLKTEIGIYCPLSEKTNPLLRYRGFFEKNGLSELVALSDFIANPSESNFLKLFIKVRQLSENIRKAFFTIPECNQYRIFMSVYDLFNDSEIRKKLLDDKLEKIYHQCKIVDEDIRNYLQERNYTSLTEKGYWKYLNRVSRIELDEEELLKILAVESRQLEDRATVDFICENIFLNGNVKNEIIWKWGKENFQLIASLCDIKSGEVALKILNHTNAIDWTNEIFQFPKQLEKLDFHSWGPSINDVYEVLIRFFHLSKGQESLWKLYSIIPFILPVVNKRTLNMLLPEDITTSYKRIKNLNNEAATCGLILCLLSTELVSSYKELILNDVILFFSNAASFTLNMLKEYLSFEGMKMLLMHEDAFKDAFELNYLYVDRVLEFLEKKTVNTSLLLKLSNEGHFLN